MKRNYSLFLLLLLLIVPTALAGNLPLVPAEAIASITERELRMHLTFLASQELGGRFTFSQGNKIAARYLASQLESFGYRGGARQGSFFQKIEFSKRVVDQQASRIKVGGENGKEYRFGEAFFAGNPIASDVSAEVVFVGYGISAPSKGYDDYDGLNVKDKIVLISIGRPSALKAQTLNDGEYGIEAAFAHGAKAALFLPAQLGKPYWVTFKNDDEENFRMVQESAHSLPPIENFPYVELSPDLARALLDSVNINLADLLKQAFNGDRLPARTLPVPFTMRTVVKDVRFEAQNVVAILDGSDPKLKQEYLLISAHYDHLKSSGEVVYAGADDDGSGTSAVLTIAHAFAAGKRPKRSILVVFHTAEEIGLLGSRFFTNIEPLVPLNAIVTNLNIDMIGRSRDPLTAKPQDHGLTDKDSLYIIGSDKHSSELHRLNEQTNQEFGAMRLDYTYNDESHPLRLFYRSDHYNYARKGIPVIFYFTGLHSDYHRHTDTIDKIDFEKLTRITRLIFATGWRVANLDHKPVVDRWQK